jgi:hypothetical protein
MTTSTRIAVLRISIDLLREKHELAPTTEGWSAFEGADGTRLEVSPRGAVLLVRFSGGVGGLSASFGELWQHHAESRGVAVHEQLPEGDDYDGLVEGASWEGGLFAQVASMLGGNKSSRPSGADEPAEAKTNDESPEAADGEPATEGEGEEGDTFDQVADQLMSAVAKRSSRKVLAARLAASQGQKDLGDVLDAMEAEEPPEGEEALVDEVEGRFGFDVEHKEMADLLGRKLEADGIALEGEESAEEDQAESKPEADDKKRAPSEADE